LPWRQTTNPYYIWVSEIILQQTTVAQGTAYYHRFLKRFPDIASLATAPLDDVLKLWEGLGYYSRARNIHHAAQDIMIRFHGQFPDNYDDIISLKGIGPYAAAAIGSFAFGLKNVVVDGNVLRFISRLYGIQTAIDSNATKKQIKDLAQAMQESQDPADFNQAIMEFGALNCTYKNPLCTDCPFNKKCVAYKKDLVGLIPIKSKKIKKKRRYFHYLIIADSKKQILIQQREEKDIWQGLYEFPLIEKSHPKDAVSLHDAQEFAGLKVLQLEATRTYKQTLTHQHITAVFYKCQVKNLKKGNNNLRIPEKNLKNYAWPRIINHFLSEEGYI